MNLRCSPHGECNVDGCVVKLSLCVERVCGGGGSG